MNVEYMGRVMPSREFYAMMHDRYPDYTVGSVADLMHRFGRDPGAVEEYMARKSAERRETGRNNRGVYGIALCGAQWSSRRAFASAFGVDPTWFQFYVSHRAAHITEIALAVMAARVWLGKDAGEDEVRKAAMELIREDQAQWDTEKWAEKAAKNAAETGAVPECPEEARAAVALFRTALPHHEDSDTLAAQWNVEAAGEGRWRFRGEELTWIVEPERERLECWRKGVMVRKWVGKEELRGVADGPRDGAGL